MMQRRLFVGACLVSLPALAAPEKPIRFSITGALQQGSLAMGSAPPGSVAALTGRAKFAQRRRYAQVRQHLDGLTRVLDSVSHKSALERGFALVRGEDGKVRRRAAAVKPGEALTLTFADGDKQAVAEGGPARAKGKKPVDQGSLF